MDSFKLQLLHATDLEAGISAVEDAPRFSAVVNGLRSELPEQTLLISSGDNYIPGPFLLASADPSLDEILGSAGAGRGDIAIVNAIGFDASALGNHEFDLGTGQVASVIAPDGDYPGTSFPYLSANLDFSEDANLSDLVVPEGQAPQPNSITKSVVFEVDGEIVGVVGATTPLLESISSPGDVIVSPPDPEDLNALAAEIQISVDNLTEQGVNKIILTSHLQQIALEQELATLLEGIDIIIAGGSDTILADESDRLRPGDEAADPYPILTESANGEPVAIVSTDGNYNYVGRLVAEFDDNGVLLSESIDPLTSGAYATDNQGVEDLRNLVANPDAVVADPDVVAITAAIQEVILEKDGNLFGSSDVFLNGEREDVRTQETNLGNLTADANLAAAQAVDDSVVISIKNGGGIRAPIGVVNPETGETLPTAANELTGKEAGDISQLDIENALRFNNELSLLTLTAEQLLAVIEHGVAATASGATPGQFPQVAGVSFSFDPDLESGNRVQSLVVEDADGNPSDVIVENGELVGNPDREFRIVTLNFLASGGDGYPFDQFAEANSERLNRVDLTDLNLASGTATFADPGTEQDALAEYLLANFVEEPYDIADVDPGQDSRIQNLNERSDTVITPLIDTSDAISLAPIGTYETGIFDEGAAEIVEYDPETQRLFVVNANSATLDVLDISDPTNIQALEAISLTSYGAVANSVDIFDGVLAVAVENEDTQLPGNAVFFDTDGKFLSSVEVGTLPDMLTFTPDGSKVLVANEGEPSDDYTVDPEGSVSIIDVSGGFENLTQNNVTTAGFTAFNDRKEELIAEGVRIFGPNATVAQDIEPEYITVSSDSTTAWIALQENNALGLLDIASGEVTDILPLGFKDHTLPENAFDASDRDDAINITNWPVFGIYQPDAIASYEVDGETFIITANEGDARDYDAYSEEARIEDLVLDPVAFPNAAELQAEEALGRLIVTTANGDTDSDGEYEELYVFGGRSFAIWTEEGELIYDSGDEFEQITAALYPQEFNSDNSENDSFDSRSDAKGPEPEGVTVGVIDDRTYAFIGLERIGGIMTYDVTDPTNPQFVQYINNRHFSGDTEAGTAGDLGVEGLTFISAEDSPNGKPLIVAANEVSGTTTVFEITVNSDGTPEPIGELIFGTETDDELFANISDTVFAGAGNDIVDASTGGGGNQLYGGDGDDELFAGSGDRLFGEAGNDILNAAVGSGGNRLYGGDGNDTLIGGTGDYAKRSAGGDRLFGGEGNDVLFAGQGDNLLNGGANTDQFWIAYNRLPDSVNTITDFQVGTDIIGIGGLAGVSSFSDLTLTQDGANTLINATDTDLAVLRGIQATALDSNSFVFA
ncbi:choice-of-anchor I family protein [Gloeocapsopsis crepidinum LEGE 06123]|uniref:Choice-of-anchor I family protein n=2 Tax=Gloeocapsopsis crepidinum TaxID=693223 RepID=A0ABR9ULE7_9CHRO|nr:choice-of-anchor I family protein [Gloeocapsopsis crepidinum]MBE9189104.1 choice-of-anchor I family protein [Gloeocapsopsis crepidinum LEGE 06123]